MFFLIPDAVRDKGTGLEGAWEKRMGGQMGEEDRLADGRRGWTGRWETFWGGSGNI